MAGLPAFRAVVLPYLTHTTRYTGFHFRGFVEINEIRIIIKKKQESSRIQCTVINPTGSRRTIGPCGIVFAVGVVSG